MLFTLSKIGWALLTPGSILLFGLVAGSVALLLPWRRVRRFGGYLLGLSVAGALSIAVLPLGAWLLAPLEDRFPPLAERPPRIDGIIALGGAVDLPLSVERHGAELQASADRITAFAALARQYPQAKLVFSGGSGYLLDQIHREADFAAPLLAGLGIAPERVIFERNSRNTWENAVHTAALVRPQAGEVWLLITSAYHMPRAMGAMRRAGWRPIAVPVDYRTGPGDRGRFMGGLLHGLTLTTIASKEWLGLLVYRWLDWTDALYPAPEVISAKG